MWEIKQKAIFSKGNELWQVQRIPRWIKTCDAQISKGRQLEVEVDEEIYESRARKICVNHLVY